MGFRSEIMRGMKKNRRAFSLLEFVLLALVVCLLAAVFVPASVAVREKARDEIIERQLATVVKKAEEYMRERDVKSVSYKTLVDAKVLDAMQPVAGENYESLTIQKSGGIAVLKKSDGKEITQTY